MSNKNEHKRQKKAEKQKAKARERRKDAASRRESEPDPVGIPGKSATLAQAAGWPVHEAWATASWPEQGARVHAAITRQRDDGRVAAAFFDLDLAERGVVSVKASAAWNEARVLAEVGSRSSDDDAMMQVEPEVVVKLVRAARDHGQGNGHEQAPGLVEAEVLLGGIDADAYIGEILVGRAPAPEPERTGGLLGAVWRYLFGTDPDGGTPDRDEDEVQTLEDFVYDPDQSGDAVLEHDDDSWGDEPSVGDADAKDDAEGDRMDAGIEAVRAEAAKPKRFWTATPSPAAAVSNRDRRSLLPRQSDDDD